MSEIRGFAGGVDHSDLLLWAPSTGDHFIYMWRHLQTVTIRQYICEVTDFARLPEKIAIPVSMITSVNKALLAS